MKLFIALCALVAVVAGDVSHLASSQYLPPRQYAASAPAVSYSAPAASYQVAASAPAVHYSAPATQSYNFESASAPAVAYSAPVKSYSAPAQSYHVEAASAPAVSYAAPVQTYSTQSYSAPAQSYHVEAASAPAVSYSAPAASYESSSFETAASEPAHTFSSNDGYRYKTNRRVVYRQRVRRDVSHLSSEYLPPRQFAASAPANDYLPPVAASSPVVQYESAPTSYSGSSYSAPASYTSSSYSAPAYETAASYSAPSYSTGSYSAPSYSTGSYSAPSYETAASEPAHSFSATDGYRYKTAKRRVIRRRS